MKSYEEQIKDTLELIEHHNKNKDVAGRLPVNDIIDKLKQEHPTEEHLKLLGYKELEQLGIEETLAKNIVRSWRSGIKVIVDASPEAEAARLGPDALVERYDPDDPANAYGTRLATIAGKDSNGNANKFIIFNGDAVDRSHTKDELRRLIKGYTSRDIAIHEDMPHKTFAVGNRPARYEEQSPWNPQEVLYDGKSNAGVPWKELPEDTKQLVLIASTSNQPDFQKYTEIELFTALERAEEEEPPSSFRLAARLFPVAAIQFHDLKRKGSLPSMKIPVGGDSTTASSATPSSATTTSTAPAPAGS